MSTLDDAFAAHAAAAAQRRDVMDMTEQSHLSRRVRRGRAARTVGRAVVAIAVVGVFAAGAIALLGREGVGPGIPGTQSPVPSESPSPTATVAPQITAEELLPVAVPASSDVFEKTGLGWSLATYEVALADQPVELQLVYLVEPAGAVYEIARLDPGPRVEIVAWRPGLDYAVVRVSDRGAGFRDLEILDLRTGALTTFDTPRARVDGRMRGLTEGGTLLVTYDETNDLAWDNTGPVAEVPVPEVDWSRAEAVDLVGSAPGAPALGTAEPFVADGTAVYVADAAGTCGTEAWAVSPGEVTPLTPLIAGATGPVGSASVTGAVDGWAYLLVRSTCGGGGLSELVRVSFDGGNGGTLLGSPLRGADAGGATAGPTSVITAVPGPSLR